MIVHFLAKNALSGCKITVFALILNQNGLAEFEKSRNLFSPYFFYPRFQEFHEFIFCVIIVSECN